MTNQNYEGVINFYGALFGDDGKEFAKQHIEAVKENTIRYFKTMEDTMPKKEYNIIKKRFGIDSEVMTINEIAEEQNISREDASALLGQAIRMLKHPSRSIKGYPILLRLENK